VSEAEIRCTHVGSQRAIGLRGQGWHGAAAAAALRVPARVDGKSGSEKTRPASGAQTVFASLSDFPSTLAAASKAAPRQPYLRSPIAFLARARVSPMQRPRRNEACQVPGRVCRRCCRSVGTQPKTWMPSRKKKRKLFESCAAGRVFPLPDWASAFSGTPKGQVFGAATAPAHPSPSTPRTQCFLQRHTSLT
jgi:hypothetical protein